MAVLRVVTTRAPGLIPSLLREIAQAPHPIVLIPESFTLACETEIIRRSPTGGLFDLPVFSPSSLIREIRELSGQGRRRPLSGDSQNMIISRALHHHQSALRFYRKSVGQPTLAAKVASQIDELTRARLDPAFLRSWQPESRRTRAKLEDLALLWEEYNEALAQGFESTVTQWSSAVSRIRASGLLRDRKLLSYGFDYINQDLL